MSETQFGTICPLQNGISECNIRSPVNPLSLQPNRDGLHPNSFPPYSDGLQPSCDGLQPNCDGIQPNLLPCFALEYPLLCTCSGGVGAQNLQTHCQRISSISGQFFSASMFQRTISVSCLKSEHLETGTNTWTYINIYTYIRTCFDAQKGCGHVRMSIMLYNASYDLP